MHALKNDRQVYYYVKILSLINWNVLYDHRPLISTPYKIVIVFLCFSEISDGRKRAFRTKLISLIIGPVN